MGFSPTYTIGFMAAVCVVCSAFVSVASVTLRERQEQNALLDRQKNVLVAAGLLDRRAKVDDEEVAAIFEDSIETVVVHLESGELDDSIDPRTFDPRRAAQDPGRRRTLGENSAGLAATAHHQRVYKVIRDGELDGLVLPISGMGLWSTLYGFLALDADLVTVRGIAFYDHGETPGLGGEVDSERWRASWRGRRAFDEEGEPVIAVTKGRAPPPERAPHEVDGLSGATITANGVTGLVHFWLGDQGFGPFLENLAEEGR